MEVEWNPGAAQKSGAFLLQFGRQRVVEASADRREEHVGHGSVHDLVDPLPERLDSALSLHRAGRDEEAGIRPPVVDVDEKRDRIAEFGIGPALVFSELTRGHLG